MQKHLMVSETAQQNAIERYREGNLDYDWWDFVYEDADRIADILGIDLRQKPVKLIDGQTRYDPAIYFELNSGCSGARFEGEYEYNKGSVKAIREHAPRDEELHRIADQLKEAQRRNFYQLYAHVSLSGRDEHPTDTRIEVERADGKELSGNADEVIQDCLRDFMYWIHRQLEREHDYLQSDEAIRETIEANEYWFDEDGNMA